MKTIIYYLADDGTRFDDEYKCRDYERAEHLKKYSDHFSFYDKNRKEINFNDEFDGEDVFYVKVNDAIGAEIVSDYWEEVGMENPIWGEVYNDPRHLGVWGYDCCGIGGWTNISNLLDDIKSELADIEGAE